MCAEVGVNVSRKELSYARSVLGPVGVVTNTQMSWKERNIVLQFYSPTLLTIFPAEYLTWTLPSLNLDTFIVANGGFSTKSITERQTVQILMRRLVTSRLIRI